METVLIQKLNELNIAYTTHEHEPVYTVEQALKLVNEIPGASCKNLFLKDSRKNLYLLIAIYDTQIKLKKLSKYLKAPELRFASPELLQRHLGVTPGAVSPFGLISDTAHDVTVLFDARLFDVELVGFHPMRNNATTVISSVDLKRFVDACGNRFQTIDFGLLE